MGAMNYCGCMSDAATRLPDDQLLAELRCVEKCALLATRTRREAALLAARCLRLELERRAQAASKELVTA
jgi:hypothetical protein